jgi:hypothetical protein
VGAVNLAFYMQDLQILANGDLGSVELSRQVYDQDSAIPTQQIEDRSLPLFVQHVRNFETIYGTPAL